MLYTRSGWLLTGFFLLVMGICGPNSTAQIVVDPTDELYVQLDIWEAKGILAPLPVLRPYPIQIIHALLDQVLISPLGEIGDRRIAEGYKAAMGDGLHPNAGFVMRTDGTDTYAHGYIDAWTNGTVLDWFTASAQARIYAVDMEDGLMLPAGTGNPEDFIADWTDIDVGDLTLQIRQISHTAVGIGAVNSPVTAQIGLMRNSVGPFWNNGIVVGPQAPVAGHFSTYLHLPVVDVTLALLELGATMDDGSNFASNKHLFYHDITVRPAPWLDISILETVITGGRFEPLYLIPLSAFFHTQGLAGFTDNSLVGLVARIRPVTGLDIKGVLYIDDLHFNDIVRLKFDTKWKLAYQAGLDWSPPGSFKEGFTEDFLEWLPLIGMSYTAVMPYMYTHINSINPDGFNYENYTSWGVNIGPALEPNSDRLEFHALMRPLDSQSFGRLDIELNAQIIRHGNASQGILPDGDGSIFDPGYTADGKPTFQPPFDDPTGQPFTRFLTQDVLETTLQLAFELNYVLVAGDRPALERGWGSARAILGYTYEHRWNAGLISGEETDRHLFNLSIGYSY